MPKIKYEDWNPDSASLRDALRAQDLVERYAAQGYRMSLRQVYYQFVSQDWIPNTERSYKRLGNIVSRGRRAGLIDWDGIEDRNRELEYRQRWRNPQEIITASARGYHIDHWDTQPFRVEVWIEKAALGGVAEQAARPLDCPWFACRGYPSDSEMWSAAQRFGEHLREGQRVVVLHLGDHDPSGVDMTRDLQTRLKQFVYSDLAEEIGASYRSDCEDLDEFHDVAEYDIEEAFLADWPRWGGEFDHVVGGRNSKDGTDLVTVRRLALTMDQIRQYQPPPNPAKLTDSRANDCIAKHGRSSWELDALPPDVLTALIQDSIREYIADGPWQARVDRAAGEKSLLTTNARRWNDVVALLGGGTE